MLAEIITKAAGRYNFDNYMNTSPNRVYLASVLRTFAQIPLWGTSDTPRTLGVIVGKLAPKNGKEIKK